MPENVSASNERFLTKEFVEAKILEIMAPFLHFESILPEMQVDARSVTYKQEAASHGSDSKKKKPRVRTSSSDWTYVNIEGINVKSAILNSYGFAVKIDRDAIRFSQGVDEINRAYKRVAYWLAQDINDAVVSAITSNATGPTTKLGTPTLWSASGASPIKDLMHVSQDMRQEGYAYRNTDTFVHDDNFYELLDYVTFLDNKKIDFQTDIGKNNEANQMTINKLPGLTVHGVLSGVTEGDIIALDSNNPCGAQYYAVDPKFAVTRADNSVSPIQVHRYTDNDTHDEVIQIWKDYVVAIKEPKAAIYGSAKI